MTRERVFNDSFHTTPSKMVACLHLPSIIAGLLCEDLALALLAPRAGLEPCTTALKGPRSTFNLTGHVRDILSCSDLCGRFPNLLWSHKLRKHLRGIGWLRLGVCDICEDCKNRSFPHTRPLDDGGRVELRTCEGRLTTLPVEAKLLAALLALVNLRDAPVLIHTFKVMLNANLALTPTLGVFLLALAPTRGFRSVV